MAVSEADREAELLDYDLMSVDEEEEEEDDVKNADDDQTAPSSSTDSMRELYSYFRLNPLNPGKRRTEALLLWGVCELSTEKIRDYLAPYEPFDVEWINDDSCNLVFRVDECALRCLHGISSPCDLTTTRDVPSRRRPPAADGPWRRCNDTPNTQPLFVRFAFQTDRKGPKSFLRSKYYRKYGNPNLGGIRGFLSRAMRQRALKDPEVLQSLERRKY